MKIYYFKINLSFMQTDRQTDRQTQRSIAMQRSNENKQISCSITKFYTLQLCTSMKIKLEMADQVM